MRYSTISKKYRVIAVISILLCGLGSTASAQKIVKGHLVSLETAKPLPGVAVQIMNRYNIHHEEYGIDTTDSNGYYRIQTNLDTLHVQLIIPYQMGDQDLRFVQSTQWITYPKKIITVDAGVSELEFKYRYSGKTANENGYSIYKSMSSTDKVAYRLARTRFLVNGRKYPRYISHIYP